MTPSRKTQTISWLIILSFIFLALLVSQGKQANRPVHSEPRAQKVTIPTELGADERNTIEIFQKASPSVVFIKNAAYQWDFFSLDIYEIPQGAGSGFMWDLEGHIVTNFHVIYQANKVDVVLRDQKSYPAEVIGVSPDHDLAVLKVDAPREYLTPLELGASKSLLVGQRVLAIGNPFGLDYSLSTGVVSALGRSITSLTGRQIYDSIQTDAAINPGNSGGPLLDSHGRLIGVTTAIYSATGANAGVSFAIPVDTVNRIVPQLIKYGRIRRVGLGVTLVPDNIRAALGIEGAMVLDVMRGSVADNAGLLGTKRTLLGDIVAGDTIVSIAGKPIIDNDGLIQAFENNQPGDKVKIEFVRDERPKAVTVTLQELQ